MIRALLALFLLPLAALAAPETWRGEAIATFEGTSTLHDWSGKVPLKPFQATVEMADAKSPLIDATLEAAVAEMDTEDEGRDENLRKAMRAEEHPKVMGRVSARIPREVVQGASGKVPIVLTLLGKETVIEGTIENWRDSGKQVTFDCGFGVSLKASGIEIPPFLFFIRVGDEIRVRVRVALTRP
jgi:hypothetical protein